MIIGMNYEDAHENHSKIKILSSSEYDRIAQLKKPLTKAKGPVMNSSNCLIVPQFLLSRLIKFAKRLSNTIPSGILAAGPCVNAGFYCYHRPLLNG